MQKGDNKDMRGTDAAAAKPAPPKKSALLLFVALLVIFALVIAATLLLANDKRNLRLLFDRYDIDWLDANEMSPPSGTRALRGRRLAPVSVSLPARFFAQPESQSLGAFVREVRAKGQDLCAAFKDAGVNNDGWRPSQFDGKTYECLSETVYASKEEGGQAASFFFIAKGTPEGEIGSIRMKLVAPETPDGETVHRLFIKAMERLIVEARWLDLAPAVTNAETLTDFTSVRFGISFRFTHEFTAPRSYNLSILPASRDPIVERSRTFFDTDGWWPLPTAIERLPEFLRPHLVETTPIPSSGNGQPSAPVGCASKQKRSAPDPSLGGPPAAGAADAP